MAPSNKPTFSKRQVVLIIAVMAAAALFFCGWYLGSQRAADKYRTEITTLKTEKTRLTDEVAAWKEKSEVTRNVSAEAALEALYARYPKNSQMESIKYPFSDCDRFSYYQTIDEWQIPFTEKAFTMKWNGVITAGIDMNEVSITANKAKDKLIVTIPAAKIISYTVEPDSFELLDERNSIFNPISLEDLTKLDEDVEIQMKDRTIDNGVLRIAEENAQLLILDVLRAAPTIGSFYEIEFRTA